ncbi:hypothetical protein MJO28_012894, partial [Puccinia striiformis f. sp. tritici]
QTGQIFNVPVGPKCSACVVNAPGNLINDKSLIPWKEQCQAPLNVTSFLYHQSVNQLTMTKAMLPVGCGQLELIIANQLAKPPSLLTPSSTKSNGTTEPMRTMSYNVSTLPLGQREGGDVSAFMCLTLYYHGFVCLPSRICRSDQDHEESLLTPQIISAFAPSKPELDSFCQQAQYRDVAACFNLLYAHLWHPVSTYQTHGLSLIIGQLARLAELLKQNQYHPSAFEFQVPVLSVGVNGILDLSRLISGDNSSVPSEKLL